MTKPKTKIAEKAAPKKAETPEKRAKTSKTAKADAKPAAKKTAAGKSKPSTGAAGKGDAAKKTSAGAKDSAMVPQPVKKPEAENPPPPAPLIPMIGVKSSVDRPPSLSVTSLARKPARQDSGQAEPAPKPPERKLSRKELADIKTILEEKREKLLSNMRREFAMQKERAESKAADDVDKATDAYDEDLSFEIATASDQGLEEIQAALEKIEKGTYGECEICGKPISPARLRILPSATVCVACRDQEEQASHRDDGPIPLFNIMTDEENGENEAEPL